MRVHLDRFPTARARILRKGVVMLLLGGALAPTSLFVGFLGALVILTTDLTDFVEARSGWLLLVFAGAFPLIGAALLIWRGTASVLHYRRLRGLAELARMSPQLDSQQISRSLYLSPRKAESLVIEAAELGLVSDDAASSRITLAPQPQGGRGGAAGDRLSAEVAKWVGATVADTYRIESFLGAGGMGAVYAARHLRTGRGYAIKLLLPDARMSPDAIRRFAREAAAATRVGHGNIVAVHDFNETADGVHYMVTDLLLGETLEQRLARCGTMPWQQARAVALDLGAALGAAHAAGILHRDLKPSNVFLTRHPDGSDKAVLLDFGLARPIQSSAASRITSTGATVGTPLYMSPEQARGEALDVRSDVYGLGAVVYEMVTGAPPFLDATLAGVYARLLTEAVKAPSSLEPSAPRELDAVLMRALDTNREHRFPDVASLCAALSSVGAAAA